MYEFIYLSNYRKTYIRNIGIIIISIINIQYNIIKSQYLYYLQNH